jgi:hypothetical protein
MRGQRVALAAGVLGLSSPAVAQQEAPAQSRTAEQFIETAREVYSVKKPEPEPCPEATAAEIVVCRQSYDGADQRLPSPTDRANAAGERPPDPIPQAPDVFGLPPCKSYMFCGRVGRAPPPIYIIDLSKIPEPLTPEEAALVFRAEDLPAEPTPAAASPAAAP